MVQNLANAQIYGPRHQGCQAGLSGALNARVYAGDASTVPDRCGRREFILVPEIFEAELKSGLSIPEKIGATAPE